MTPKKNLVLTLAHGYKWPQLSIFVNSLRKNDFDGDIVVFASRIDRQTARKLKERGVIVLKVFLPLVRLRNVFLVPGWKPWRWLFRITPGFKTKREIAKYVFNIMCARFACFHDYLECNLERYDKVVIADVKDVCFQGNPFESMETFQIVSFLEELLKIGVGNIQWMEEAFGSRLDPTILEEIICCAGVTIGTSTAVHDYLTKMLKHLYQVEIMTPVLGVDQAVHNFLFHRGQLEGSAVMNNGNPICMTMGPGYPYELDANQNVVAGGSVISILHQYDRHPELKRIITGKYAD